MLYSPHSSQVNIPFVLVGPDEVGYGSDIVRLLLQQQALGGDTQAVDDLHQIPDLLLHQLRVIHRQQLIQVDRACSAVTAHKYTFTTYVKTKKQIGDNLLTYSFSYYSSRPFDHRTFRASRCVHLTYWSALMTACYSRWLE